MELSQKMDKENKHIDQDFIDHSWQNMSELLDKDMPVQKRKRKFIWFWFFGLAAIISLAVIYGYGLAFNQNIEPTINKKKLENIAQTTPLTIDNQEITKKKEDVAPLKKSRDKPVNASAIKKSRTSKTNKNNAVVKVADRIIPPNESVNKPLISPASNLLIVENENTTKAATTRTNKIINPLIESNFNKSKKTTAYLALLPLVNSPLTIKERQTEIIPIISPVPTKVTKWRFGVYGSLLTNKLGSFRAGFHSNILLNPKWTLHVGLGYSTRFKKDLFGNNAQNEAALANNDNTGSTEDERTGSAPDPTFSGGTLEEASLDPIIDTKFNYTKFNYFELPVLIQYSFRPRWTIDIGGQIVLTHKYHYKRPANGSIAADKFYTADVSNFAVIQNNYQLIDNLSFTAISGISFQVSPKLSAYSSYHFSNFYLKNLPNNAEDQRKWQKIEVGIRYYLK